MNKNSKVLLLALALVVASAFAVFFINLVVEQASPPPNFPFTPRIRTPYNPADIELYYLARTVVSTLNIGLLIILIVSYVSIYYKTKSEFTVGLLLFAVFFLIKDVSWHPFVVRMAGFNVFGLGPFAFLPDLFELIALSLLVYLSIEY